MNVLPLLTAFTAGLAHAIEPDHVAAVTTFVSRRPKPLEAVGFGLRWGIGHSMAILVVGGILIALDLNVPDNVTRGLEFGVGMMLVGLGLWLLWNVLHERAHRLAGDSSHSHGAHGHHHHHEHKHGSLWVGLAHGLAGTAPFIAVIPVALVKSPWQAGAYLLLFG
ncbi:MAG TPA: hypothetical protein VFQ39_01610, partial [Longimicrobium sp.]|nr:hypothetical protein [Longimicrobium sp.]